GFKPLPPHQEVMNIRKQTRSILMVVFCTFLFSIAQIFYKNAAERLSFSFEGIILNYFIWIALVLYGIGTLIFTYALKNGELSVLYPVISTSFIWVALFSFFIFDEPITFMKGIGISAIVLGVILLNSYKEVEDGSSSD
ncbi:MAG: hypothetical protein PWR30_536, partial [Candidatus Woesearchaeota archaeon]|nr:hypothetical protein [Candidatus Woesearchaeota archaeon]